MSSRHSLSRVPSERTDKQTEMFANWVNRQLESVGAPLIEGDVVEGFNGTGELAKLLQSLTGAVVRIKSSKHAAVRRSNIDEALNKFKMDENLRLGGQIIACLWSQPHDTPSQNTSRDNS